MEHKDIIIDTILADRKCRNKPLEPYEDLHLVSEIEPAFFDFDHPTLLLDSCNQDIWKQMPHQINTNLKQYLRYYSLTKFDFQDSVLIAGGSLARYVLGKEYKYSDVDFFIYGVTEEEAQKRVDDIYEYIYKSQLDNLVKKTLKDNSSSICSDELRVQLNSKFRVSKSKNCLTIKYRGDKNILTYQIIYRIYKSPSEILHGFDLGSSSIGYDGNHIYTTTMGKLSYRYLINILDTTRRSVSYEARLYKYLNIGFKIVMPEFDIDKIPMDSITVYNIPGHITTNKSLIRFTKVTGNRIYISQFMYKTTFTNDYDEDYVNDYAMINNNIAKIVDGKSDELYIYSNTLSNLYKLTNSADHIRMIYKDLYDKITDGYVFPIYNITRKFGEKMVDKIFAMRNDKVALKKLFDDQIKFVSDGIKSVDLFKWVTTNPSTQLTSSFNPIMEDPKEWYGAYYKPHDRL